jgi:uncharacterized damage-inducible protein DinB
MTESKPEAWLRGSIDGYEPLLMPIVHSLIQAREDVEGLVARVPEHLVWERPGGAASIGFHVLHLGGALDRLLTYARGEALSDAQKVASREEDTVSNPAPALRDVANAVYAQIDRALEQIRTTRAADLQAVMLVGRAKIPVPRMGLLFHAAEHCTRHAGQAITTAKILAGMATT